MPKGTTKRRPQTRARMIDAALDVFAEVGFSGATIGMVCQRAGFTTGAFYSNFDSKDELFLALFDANAASLQEQFSEAIASIPASGMSIEGVVTLLATTETADKRWFLISAEFLLYAIRNPEAAHRLAAHQAALRADLAVLFTDVLTNLGFEVTVDIDRLVRVLVALRDGSHAQSLVDPDALPIGTIERDYMPIIIAAVTTPGPPPGLRRRP